MCDLSRVRGAAIIGLCVAVPVLGQWEPVTASLEDFLDVQITSAALHEQSSREAPASVTVITAADIERRGYRTLSDALRDTPSFYLTNDRNYEFAGVRGFSRPGDYNTRLLVLVDGTAMNESIWGSVPIGQDLGINMLAVDRIEIVRGPGSALYGTNAMFAVINVFTKSGKQQDGLTLGFGAGGDGLTEGRAFWGRQYDSGLDLAVGGQWGDTEGGDHYFAEYDDPETNDGVAEGVDWENYLGLTARASLGDWRLQSVIAKRETALPTGAFETSFNGSTQTLDEFETVEARYDRDLGSTDNLMVRATYYHYHYKGRWDYDGDLFLDESHNNSVYAEARYRRDLLPENRLIIGAEIRRHYNAQYREWDAEATYFDGELPFTVVSAYAQDEQQLTTNLALTLGFRVDHYSHVETAYNPRVALVYHPARRHTFKLLYGEAFRAPGMYELQYASDLGGLIPNPDLKPERIHTMEAVWEGQVASQVTAVASLYRYRMRRLIDQVFDPAAETIQHRNINRVHARGLEIGLEGLLAATTGYASYSYERTEDTSTMARLSNYPTHQFKTGLFVPIIGSLEGHGRLVYESARRTERGNNTDSSIRTNLGLRLAPTGPHVLSGHLTAWLTVDNVFDVDHAVPGGLELIQDQISQDGRRINLHLDLRY